MIPLDVVGSESIAADLPYQVRWRDGVESPAAVLTFKTIFVNYNAKSAPVDFVGPVKIEIALVA